MAKEVFEEKQAFTQWWIWLILLAVLGYEIKLTYDLYQLDDYSGRTVMAYLLIMLPILLVLLLFAFSKLYTRVDEHGIEVVFKPFGFTKRKFNWDQIEKAESVKYNPIKEFGGWGYRISWKGKGTAMNVKGNRGIQLIMKNNKKFLIGTQRPEEALGAINAYINASVTNT